VLVLALAMGPAAGAGVPKRGWGSPSIPVSGVIIPGFASSRLRAWAILDCPYSPLDFRPLDPVWLDTKKVTAQLSLHCLLLQHILTFLSVVVLLLHFMTSSCLLFQILLF
jgi:hypothetical protein